MDTEIYKLFGPISVITTGLAVIAMIYTWHGDKSKSISQHAAAHRSSYLMMLMVQTITLPMLFLFLAKWLAPTLKLPILFTVCVGLACLGLLIAAWIPDITGWKSKLHGLFAYGAAMLVIPATTILYLSANISLFARYMTLAVLVYELGLVTAFFVIEKIKDHHLYFQAAYIFLFAFTTIAAAYVR